MRPSRPSRPVGATDSGAEVDSALGRRAKRGKKLDPETSDLTGRSIGRFEVGERIGRGGMGVVHRAVDSRLRRSAVLAALMATPGLTWDVLTVESAGYVGRYTSLVVVNGHPAISYYDLSSGADDLKYVRATDPDGASWPTPVVVDAAGNVGSFSSLAVVNGRPAISYFDAIAGDLKYARASDPDGAAWGVPIAIDTVGVVGESSSLAVVAGNPAISYTDFGNRDLRYVRATDADGAAWGSPVVVVGPGEIQEQTSLCVVNGNPAISFLDLQNYGLKYVRALDPDGAVWGAPVTLDVAAGEFNSLVIVNGKPAIGYFDLGTASVSFVRAMDSDGTSWGTSLVVDAGGIVGEYVSLAIVNGHPAMSYYEDGTAGNLRYVRASDPDGTTWNAPQVVDTAGWAGQYTSLAVVNGFPAISYHEQTAGDLRYAYFGPVPVELTSFCVE